MYANAISIGACDDHMKNEFGDVTTKGQRQYTTQTTTTPGDA